MGYNCAAMLKYSLGFFLVFGLAVYVAIQDDHAALQSTQEAQLSSKGDISAVPDANHPQQNVPDSERNTPSWYGFFRWPNGTTTWAILLTLLVIAEQTKQTARAAKATQDSIPLQKASADAAKASADALVNSERAWIIVNIRWTQGKPFFVHSTSVEGSANTARETTGVDVDLLYINEGRSPAWIVEEKVRMEVAISPISSPSLDTEDTQFNERYEPVSVNKTSTNQHRIFGQGWNGSHTYIYGRIKYRDIFTPPPIEPRETWFGFRVNATGHIGRIVSYEYNRFT